MGRGTNFFRHGDLPAVVLALLRREPMHGYKLLAGINELCGPDYEASPGSVYPAVPALREAGLISEQPDGRRRLYSITDSGIDALRANRDRLAQIERRTGRALQSALDVDVVIARFSAAVHTDVDKVDVV